MAAEARPGRDTAGPEPAGETGAADRRGAAVFCEAFDSQGAGGGPEPLLPTPQLNVHLGSKSKPGSSAAVFLFLFCSRWLNTAFLTFMPKNILPVPLRQDGGERVQCRKEELRAQAQTGSDCPSGRGWHPGPGVSSSAGASGPSVPGWSCGRRLRSRAAAGAPAERAVAGRPQ